MNGKNNFVIKWYLSCDAEKKVQMIKIIYISYKYTNIKVIYFFPILSATQNDEIMNSRKNNSIRKKAFTKNMMKVNVKARFKSSDY